ncbi:regulatory protein [Mycobacterium tuberculosis]|nr:regulatory protein [Mycobacterium tuberculosis]
MTVQETIRRPEHLPLRGREPERGLLRERLAALAGGEGGAVVVEGPPGSGRTRLLAETRALAAGAGLACRHGAGSPSGLPVPFGPLLEALWTGPEPLPDASGPYREIRDRLARSAERGPLVVCLDDLDGCDPATLDALVTLVDGLAGLPLLWVLVLGPVPPGAPVSLTRIRDRAGHRIVLGRMADGAVAELAADLLRAEPDESVSRVLRAAPSLPRPVVELVLGMLEEGLVTVGGGVARTTGEAIPRRFRALVRRLLDRLPPAVRQGLQAASALDRTFTAGELGGLTGSTAGETTAMADDAAAVGILLRTGAFLQFRDDLVRRAVAGTLPAAVRRSLRRRAVDVRLARGASAASVAAALAETAVAGDHRAVALLREAAAGLAGTAPAEAATLVRRALELAGPAGPHTAEIAGEAVDLLGRAGRHAEARAMAGTALAGFLTPESEADLRLRLARLVSRSSSAEAVRQCETALALPGLPEPLRARLTAVRALQLARAGEVAEAIAAAEPMAGGADDATASAALAALSTAELARLNLARAVELRDRADARSGTPEAAARAFLLTASGQVEKALREADEGVRAARRTGQAAAAHLWSMSRARIVLDAGRPAAARTQAEAALMSAGDLATGDFADTTARYALGRAALHLEDREGLRRCAADGARMMGADTPAVRCAGAWLAALAADASGDTARAADHAERAWRGGRVPGAPPDPADLVLLARLALRAGRPGLAAGAADRAARLDPGFPLLRGVAAHARGLVDDDPDLLLRAAELLKQAGRPLVHASAAEDAGRALGLSGDPGARDLLDTALALYEESGAARDAARVRRGLRLLGARPARRPRNPSDEARWGLTAAEVKVARLVAQGATNRQVAEQLFLSRHTVNTHVRHIFTKWGINSRVDLARRVLSREGHCSAGNRPG